MSLVLRLACVAGAVVTFLFITSSVRRKRVQIEDSIFWVLLSASLLVIALFPEVAKILSRLVGFEEPSNFIFVTIIAILLTKLFSLSTEVSLLKHRLNELAQEEALAGVEPGSAERRRDGARQATTQR